MSCFQISITNNTCVPFFSLKHPFCKRCVVFHFKQVGREENVAAIKINWAGRRSVCLPASVGDGEDKGDMACL